MIYKCEAKQAMLELRDKSRSSAFYLRGQLMFVGSSTIAMKYFVEHCQDHLDRKILRTLRKRLDIVINTKKY
tara:strand:- start:57 stop:272 length:216 start_codon:yes stop_codon:yes gene_type:complete